MTHVEPVDEPTVRVETCESSEPAVLPLTGDAPPVDPQGEPATSSTLIPRRRALRFNLDTLVDATAALELPPGTVIAGDFRVVRRLMRGDVGTLYEVEQRSTGRLRAMKVLDAAGARPEAEREHFLREARVMARAESPHCVDVVAAGSDAATDTLWIATERLAGETLAERLSRLGVGVALEPSEAWEVLDQLFRGLAAVHEAGVVHRDLKPANVFLARGATPFRVKILDFSAAHVIGDAHDPGAPVGTPLWMAPEQAAGHEVTPATDVWAVGLLAFRMLTGRSYWWSARNAVVETRAFADELVSAALPSAGERARALGCTRDLPDGFDPWFARCIAREPRRRFRSADEAAFALRDLRAPERPSAAPAPSPPRQQTMPSLPAAQWRRPQPTPDRASSAPALPGGRPSTPSSPSTPALRSATPSSPSTPALRSATPSSPSTPALRSSTPPSAPAQPATPPERPSFVPSPSRPPALHHDDPLTFVPPASEALTRRIPRPPPPRPAWRPIALGAAAGVALVAGAVAHVSSGTAAHHRTGAPATHAHAPPAAPAVTPDPAAPAAPAAVAESRPAAATSARAPAQRAADADAPSGPPLAWGARAHRMWVGRASGDDGDWSLALVLALDGGRVRGRAAWTAVRSPTARVGEQVRESVEGTWSAATGSLELRGTASTAPSVLPVNAYRLRAGADGSLRGATLDERTSLTATAAPPPRRR